MAGFESGFEQGPEDDPFAGSEESFGLSEEERQAAEQANDAAMEAEAPGAAQAVAEPPVVDREGQPVETTADGSPAAAQGAGVDPEPPERAEAIEGAASEAAAAPIAQAEKAEPPEAPEVEAAHEEQAEVDVTQVQAEQAAAAVGEQTAGAEAAVETEGAQADPPAATESGPTEAPSSTEPGAEAGAVTGGEDSAGATDAAEQPPEGKGKRRYLLFTPQGDGTYREVEWYEKNGKAVAKGTVGARKQKVLLARGQEDALRFGHEALGSPAEGSSLVAVAASYFQVRKVKPDVQPVRQRLKIS